MDDKPPAEVKGTASYDKRLGVLTVKVTQQSGRVETTRYTVDPLTSADGEFGHGALRLTKKDGSTYDLIHGPYGWECECQDFHGRRQNHGQLCKHLKAVLKLGLPRRLTGGR